MLIDSSRPRRCGGNRLASIVIEAVYVPVSASPTRKRMISHARYSTINSLPMVSAHKVKSAPISVSRDPSRLTTTGAITDPISTPDPCAV